MAQPLRLRPPDDAEFAPFGRWIRPPRNPGERLDLGFALAARDDAPTTSRAHVNHVRASALPLTVTGLEQHPRAWQAFLPFDITRYVVVVTEIRPDGGPDPARLRAFLVPGNTGVAYAPGTWHAGATALDRSGHFTVLWPRAPYPVEDDPMDTIRAALPDAVLVGP